LPKKQNPMKITLNNRPEEFDADQLTFSELITGKNFTFKLLVTRLNGELVRKEDRDATIIKDGDDVTVLHLISGG
jgi:thiamine biosynthesis protein ThiS